MEQAEEKTNKWTKVAYQRLKDRQLDLNPEAVVPATPSISLNKQEVYQKRSPLTTEKTAELEGLMRRSLYIKEVEGDFLLKIAKTRPIFLQKEITQAAGCAVEAIQRADDSLCLIFPNEENRKQGKKMEFVAGKRVRETEPRALTQPSKHTPNTYVKTDYEIKEVIFGIKEDDEGLQEIAAE